MATIGARIAERDRRRFVGRRPELAFLERCLEGETDAAVVFVHGPGGIGKSTLLRELARRAGACGRRAHFVEGRELAPAPLALDEALGPAREDAAPLVLIDTYELMGALDGYLREQVVTHLPERALVVIAGRERPSRGWFEGGWEGLAVALELGGLSSDEAHELLSAHGVEEGERAIDLVAWAEGSPLALALASDDALATAPSPAPGREGREDDVERPELVRALIHRLAQAEIDGPHPGPLAVAAVARVTTIDLLREVLPDVDAVQAYMWLRERSFAEPLGEGIALHDLVRKALHADLRHRDLDRERMLRRRIVDHLHARARAGHELLSIDLAHLMENEAIRWGFSWEGSGEYRVDEVRPGDADEVRERLGERDVPERWPHVAPYFERAPERISLVRDLSDRIRGFQLSVTIDTAPAFADEDVLLGPWLAHARERADGRDAVLWQAAVDFTGDPRGRVQSMLGMSGILRSGVVNPRFCYLPIDPRMENAVRFAQMSGGVHVEELDRSFGAPVKQQCWVIDFGLGGLVGAQRNLVYAELGLVPPPTVPVARTGAAEETGRAVARSEDELAPDPVTVEDVREALRNLRIPHKLAVSPLASGTTQERRAASVRARIDDAAARAFGATPNEELLRKVLVRGYLDPAPSHEQAADELALSRAAYFRRLRAAAERVAALVAESA